ncbi:unnamed protein product [Effrenium voratum]|uniref:Uncharacterized protein n=1 Tax=Effrenium voratum TaxID=2562239 RepID=A0AA36N5M1_9DINO|nr:unnamed protein product [Effrenium voratum]
MSSSGRTIWPEPQVPKPFVHSEPAARVEMSHWFIGCLLYPVFVRMLQAGYLHATSKRAQEGGVSSSRHFRAAMFFVQGVAQVEVLFLAWPMSFRILLALVDREEDYHGGGVHTHGLEYTLMHVDWRLFRWALAILCSTLIVELIQSPLRFYKSLHHISILVAACLMSGIHWISAFDLLLFASGPLLQMSFEAFNGLGWFILSYHYMRPTKNNSKLLRGTMIYMTTFSTLSHASLVVLYCCTFHRFQAWAPQAVLLLLQLCLLCENVYTVCKVRRLSQENFKRLPSQQSSMALPSLLGVCGAEARVKKMSTV